MIRELYGDTIDNSIYPNILLRIVEYTQGFNITNGITAHWNSSMDSINLCEMIIYLS